MLALFKFCIVLRGKTPRSKWSVLIETGETFRRDGSWTIEKLKVELLSDSDRSRRDERVNNEDDFVLFRRSIFVE